MTVKKNIEVEATVTSPPAPCMNLFTCTSLLSWVGLLLAGAGCCGGLVLCVGTSPGAGAATIILSLGWMVIIYTTLSNMNPLMPNGNKNIF